MNAAMNKGVVLEINEKSIIVLTPTGSFERIPSRNRSCQVGEEIVYASRPSGIRQPVFAVMSVLVAAVVFCMMLFSGIPEVMADKSVVAYVSIDINPSVEMGIDKRERVREMHGLNEKGLELVRSLKYSGKPLEEVTDKLLQKAEEMKVFESGEADIIIASTLVKEDASLDDNLVSEHLKQQVLAHVVSKHPEQAEKIGVTAFTAPSEILDTAKENGLSLGKYSVYLNAKNEGNDVKVEDLKQDSVHNIAKETGGISRLVDPAKLKKDSIKELYQEEKNGSLDKKVQDKKKENDKKNSVKPSTKTSPTPGKATGTPASPKASSPTPTPKPTNKPTDSKDTGKKDDDNKSGGDKNDNKNNGDNGSGNDKKNDSKDDGTGRETGSSSTPSGNGPGNSNKDDKPKQEDKASPGKDEDRKASGPSADVKQPAPQVSAAALEDGKESKNEKNDNKTENGKADGKEDKKDDKK